MRVFIEPNQHLEAAVPPGILADLRAYALHGRSPCSFVRAVLVNDLREAVRMADNSSAAALAGIVRWCHWCLPGACWGTMERVGAWQERHAEERAREEVEA